MNSEMGLDGKKNTVFLCQELAKLVVAASRALSNQIWLSAIPMRKYQHRGIMGNVVMWRVNTVIFISSVSVLFM